MMEYHWIFVTVLACWMLLGRSAAQSGGGCGSQSTDELRELRLQSLGHNIRAQLGITNVVEPPPGVDYPTEDELDQDLLSNYESITEVEASNGKCTTDDFYAKSINSFIGQFAEVEVQRERRAAESQETTTSYINAGLLNEYTITLNFQLPTDQQEISRANLLLHQIPSDVFSTSIVDNYQMVEIQTVIDNVRHFVGEKKVSVFGHNYTSFDVTRAAELWIDEEVSGEVKLEVLVKCYSSPNCSAPGPDGSEPPKVSFTHNATDSYTLPRIITYSKNLLEYGGAGNRQKRSAATGPTTSKPVFCNASSSDFCCLHALNISFKEDLNMRFVVKPPTFPANFCNGYCHQAAVGTSTIERALLLQHLSSRPTSSIEPCCTGLEYSPLEVVMSLWDPKKERFTIKIERLSQVTVTKCRCG